jgi:hypothetical protein
VSTPFEVTVSIDGAGRGTISRVEVDLDANTRDMATIYLEVPKSQLGDYVPGAAVEVKTSDGASIFQGRLKQAEPQPLKYPADRYAMAYIVVRALGPWNPRFVQEITRVGPVRQLPAAPLRKVTYMKTLPYTYTCPADRYWSLKGFPHNYDLSSRTLPCTLSYPPDRYTYDGEVILPFDNVYNSAIYRLGSTVDIPIRNGEVGTLRAQIMGISQRYFEDLREKNVCVLKFWGVDLNDD